MYCWRTIPVSTCTVVAKSLDFCEECLTIVKNVCLPDDKKMYVLWIFMRVSNSKSIWRYKWKEAVGIHRYLLPRSFLVLYNIWRMSFYEVNKNQQTFDCNCTCKFITEILLDSYLNHYLICFHLSHLSQICFCGFPNACKFSYDTFLLQYEQNSNRNIWNYRNNMITCPMPICKNITMEKLRTYVKNTLE